MADILPECLIQKILCFLSFKEATKMTILSKTWLQACLTLPNLKFTVDYHNDNMKIVDHIMERYRDGKIPIEKFELSNSVFSSELFWPSIDKWLYIALQNGVKHLFFGGFGLKLPIFKILSTKSLRELVLSDCSLNVSFTRCNSLRKLSLTRIDLDENMLQTILDSCPFVVTLILRYCSGLKKIELLNIEHLSYCGSGEELDVVECRNLKSLDISNVRICNGFLRDFISRYQSLKVLKIQSCGGVRDIDASNLVSFVYEGYGIPQLKNARVLSSQLKHSKIGFKCHNLSAEWFCKLRKFLSNSTSWSQISLSFSGCNDINIKDLLQLHHGVATPHVDVLDVHILWQDWAYPTFLDALLWSCQPRRLNIQLKSNMFTCFIKRVMYIKNLRHSPLKQAKVYKFGKKNQDWHRVKFKRGKLSMRTIRECEKYLFLLDW